MKNKLLAADTILGVLVAAAGAAVYKKWKKTKLLEAAISDEITADGLKDLESSEEAEWKNQNTHYFDVPIAVDHDFADEASVTEKSSVEEKTANEADAMDRSDRMTSQEDDSALKEEAEKEKNKVNIVSI